MTRTNHWQKGIRKLINDQTCTPHSCRHTFYTLSRRAGCDRQVIEAIAGHTSEEGSQTAKGYGRITDEVLRREPSKLWDFALSITG